MSVFLKRGKWWGRKENGETKRFSTEQEAYDFTGETKPKPKRRRPKSTVGSNTKKVVTSTFGGGHAQKEASNTEESSEETSTDE